MRRYQLTVNGKDVTVDVGDVDADRFQVKIGDASFDVAISEGNEIVAARTSQPALARVLASAAVDAGAPIVRAPMPGLVLSIDVAEGAIVTRGQALLMLEAMKMRNSIRSPRDGVVRAIHVTTGQSVGYDDPLIEVTPA